ncbi:MAG: hypothetical protein ABIQ35_08380, partial [Verrucomicrobiota bacterium]
NSGAHRFDDLNQNGIDDRIDLQELLYPLAKQYGVQIIFNGHDHAFEKFVPTNGIYSFVSGGGGGALPQYFFPQTPNSAARDPGSCEFYLSWHFLTVSVDGDTARVEAIGTNGLVFDSTTIRRTPPPAPVLHEASWHTPLVEITSGNDGHGNIAEQMFDLIGTPLLTAGGEFSNLGRVFVNNDSTNLYIGFEQTMVSADNNIFLFVGSPYRTGVSNLVGLGDGIPASAEGVEGLDCLENLAFTNFNPSIAVLLGDEFADGNDRFFSRQWLALENVGQGVFQLDTNFGTVESARLQQFNRSPQRLEPLFQLKYPEQNANFIKVAIPLSVLGVNPGEVLHFGAVVGGGTFDAALQARQLDSSFLGASFSGGGLSNSILAGLAVRLALDPNGDEDADGLPNGWEQQYGLDPRSALAEQSALGDPDQDGMNNLAEFVAGTDPKNAASALRIYAENLATNQILLSWSAVAGRTYQLQIAAKLDSFTNHPSGYFPHTAVSNTEYFLDGFTNSPRPEVLYYRLEVKR